MTSIIYFLKRFYGPFLLASHRGKARFRNLRVVKDFWPPPDEFLQRPLVFVRSLPCEGGCDGCGGRGRNLCLPLSFLPILPLCVMQQKRLQAKSATRVMDQSALPSFARERETVMHANKRNERIFSFIFTSSSLSLPLAI